MPRAVHTESSGRRRDGQAAHLQAKLSAQQTQEWRIFDAMEWICDVGMQMLKHAQRCYPPAITTCIHVTACILELWCLYARQV